MAVAKKKAVPAKGAWVPPWAKKDAAKKKTAPKKKVVAEKKTGEKYASKAAMAKHEKGESKKMRMKEGEIPMAKGGGKATKKKVVAKVKKYQPGGRFSKDRALPPRESPNRSVEATKPTEAVFNANNAATADSTNYYKGKANYLNDAVSANLLAGNLKGSVSALKARNKANKDRLRQKNKGESGYDSNGFPAKVLSRGGKVTKMKKAAPVTKMKRGGKC